MTVPSSSVKNRLAERLNGVSESATLKLNAAVQELKAQGVDVINLSAGEPDFPVPALCKEAAMAAIRADRSHYTPAAGIPELREKIAQRLNEQQPSLAKTAPWKGAHVVVSNGAKQAIFQSLQCTINLGDEVIIPSPYWLSYPEMVKLAGGRPVMVETLRSEGYRIRPEALENAITGKTKAILINSPSNPTGAISSREELKSIGQVIQKKSEQGIFVISDEIYDRLVYGQKPFCSFLEANPELRDWTITANGFSKSAAMTGWRVGWSVAQPAITQAILTLQGQSTSGINSVAQWASLAAFQLKDEDYAPMIGKFSQRRTMALEILQQSRKLDVVPPDGAFYIFVGVQKAMREGEDLLSFCERIIHEAKVAVVPGTPFGDPGSVRLSFATDERQLQEGCRRFVQYLENQ